MLVVVYCVVDLSSLGHNVCPGETECMSELVGGMAEHAVVMGVDCGVDLSSLGQNVGPGET